MKKIEALKSILLCWDWVIALLGALASYLVFPNGVSYQIAKEIFAVSISVLAIIFSVFFAALAILITAGDNEFVRFLEQDGSYRRIVWTFKVTLLLQFLALMASIVLFVLVLPWTTQQASGLYPQGIMFGFTFLALYALLAAMNSSLDAITYAELRARFLEIPPEGDGSRTQKRS